LGNSINTQIVYLTYNLEELSILINFECVILLEIETQYVTYFGKLHISLTRKLRISDILHKIEEFIVQIRNV